jgi:hypothetical protein
VHSASLDGPATVRQRRAKRSWLCACCSSRRNTRGAHSFDCSMSCAKRHAVMLSRTLRQVSDLSMLFCRPTAPHLAAFYLAIARSAVSSPPFLRDPSTNCDRTKKPDQTPRQRIPRKFVAVDMLNLWRPHGALRVGGSSEARRRSCGGSARCLQIGHRKATSRRPSDVAMPGVVDADQERGHGNIDATQLEHGLARTRRHAPRVRHRS